MKKRYLFLMIFTFSLIITGCNSIEEKKAAGIIKNYYQAVIDEDYDKAFEQLQLYDYDAKTGDGHFTKGTILSNEDAKAFYIRKVNVLKEKNYHITDFEIIEVEYEDGHSFWHHIKLTVEQDGQKFEWKIGR